MRTSPRELGGTEPAGTTDGELGASQYRELAEMRFQVRRFLRFSEDAARAAGVEPQQHQALLALKGMPPGRPASIGALADRLQIRHHSAVELVDRLVQGGLVQRARDPADQRQVLLTPTANGLALVRDLSVSHHAELQEVGPALVRALEALISTPPGPPATGAVRLPSDEEAERSECMASVTRPLHEEHKTLLGGVDALRATADSVGDVGIVALRQAIHDAYVFLTGSLMPHAAAEELVLYPEVQRLLRDPYATDTMVRDHAEIDRLREQLGAFAARFPRAHLTRSQRNELRGLLYGLHTLLRVHFAKEEENYLPLLDERLTADEAEALFERMEEAAAKARAAA